MTKVTAGLERVKKSFDMGRSISGLQIRWLKTDNITFFDFQNIPWDQKKILPVTTVFPTETSDWKCSS